MHVHFSNVWESNYVIVIRREYLVIVFSFPYILYNLAILLLQIAHFMKFVSYKIFKLYIFTL